MDQKQVYLGLHKIIDQLSTTDAIVLGIIQSTNTEMAAEVFVMSSDTSSTTSEGAATLTDTPQPQSSLSRNIVQTTVFSLALFGKRHQCVHFLK